MPYVEGFGTWPFGEEWLWEAIVGSYVPLLELLDAGAPLTLSLTPVLCDQLEAPGVEERFADFVERVRRHTHEEDAAGLRAGGHEQLARELERSWGDYEGALRKLRGLNGGLLGALAPYAQWTSSATHAVLPLLATDDGVRLQLHVGIDAHRARFGADWRGGFWLPECAYVRRLEPLLADAGAHATCVELTDRFGAGAAEHLRPLRGDAGLVLVPIDRQTIDARVERRGLSRRRGIPRLPPPHRSITTRRGATTASPYDHARALAKAREHAADFVARTAARLRDAGDRLPGAGLAVCALDTELLGHWWYEGVAWLRAVVEECERQGLELVRLDDALERAEPAPASEWRRARSPAPADAGFDVDVASSWGAGRDLSTWSGPAVAEVAFAAARGPSSR